jgi:hypothetical protein
VLVQRPEVTLRDAATADEADSYLFHSLEPLSCGRCGWAPYSWYEKFQPG